MPQQVKVVILRKVGMFVVMVMVVTSASLFGLFL